MWAHGFRVSFTPLSAVLFTFPSRYLCAIGLPGVLSLGGWCRLLRTGFLRPRPTQGSVWVVSPFRVRGCHPLRPAFPGAFRYNRFFLLAGPTTPRAPRRPRFGLAPFRSPLLGGSLLFSFPPTTGMFRFVGFASPIRGCRASARRVAPFGHLRINGRSRLPADFRGLPRPSSPPGAKASSVRPRSLLALREFPRRARAPAGSLSFVVSSSLCVCFPSNPVKEPRGTGIADASRRSGECGARTHDPRLAKPVL